MPSCAMKGCTISDTKIRKEKLKVGMHLFPKDDVYKIKWLQACKKENINLKCARICSLHFRPECYQPLSWVQMHLEGSAKKFQKLLPDAVPTEHLPSEEGVDITLKDFTLEEQAQELHKTIQRLEEEIQKSRMKWKKTDHSHKSEVEESENVQHFSHLEMEMKELPAFAPELAEDVKSGNESGISLLKSDIAEVDWRLKFLEEKKKNEALRKILDGKTQKFYEEKRKIVEEALKECTSLEREIGKWKRGYHFYKRRAESIQAEIQLVKSEKTRCREKLQEMFNPVV